MSKRRHNVPVEVTQPARNGLTLDTPVLISADHIRHAAHYMYNHPARGHDLDRWVIRSATRPTPVQMAALGLPFDAECATGYIEAGTGRQHWVYSAKRPLAEGTCERCGAVTPTS